MKDTEKGFYNKFHVARADGSSNHGGKHANCEYFVIDLIHDKYAKDALMAYAIACEQEYPALAKDLFEKVSKLNNT